MQHNSQRGAANISAIWFIAVLVLFFGTAFLAYQAGEARTDAEALTKEAIAEAVLAKGKLETESTAFIEFSRIVGFVPEGSLKSSSENASEAARNLKDAIGPFPGVGDTFEEIAAAIPPKFAALLQAVTVQQSQIEDLRNQVTSSQATNDTTLASKDAEIRQGAQALQDAIDAANRERGTLEDQIASLRNTNQELTGEMNSAKALRDEAERNLLTAKNESQTHISILTSEINKIAGTSKSTQDKDGEILESSSSLGIAILDLGARNKVSLGMVFTVVSGRPGSELVKGSVEIIDVGELSSTAKVFGLADPNDPIVQGDLLYNPVFQPGAEQNAVLAGRFGGTWTEADLRMLLGDIGITVQDTLDQSTSILIVGEPLYTDPDTDEALEEPIPVSELEVYKNAESKGVQIVHIGDLRRFFKK
jgi:hypothetical protein